MDKGGFFLVYRGVFEDFERKPYSELEAWLWLIGAAGYENGDRGQVRTSLSELAKAWTWTTGKKNRPHSVRVQRFLAKMLEQGRISYCYNNRVNPLQRCYNSVTTCLSITICNYARYQRREHCSVTTPLQVGYNEKLIRYNPPIFGSLKQKKENKEINKEVPIETIGLSGPVHPKPNSQVQTDTPVTKTKAQIKREKAEAKKAEREQLLVEIKNKFPAYKQQYPEINIELEYEKMDVWLHSSSRGKIRTKLHDVWENWLRTAQTRIDIAKITYKRNNKPKSEPSLLEQMQTERAKRLQFEEELKNAF